VILLVTMLLASILCSGFENGESHGQLCFVIWKQEKKIALLIFTLLFPAYNITIIRSYGMIFPPIVKMILDVFLHWCSYREDYYQEGNHVYPRLKVLEAYKRALTTWARWIDKNIDGNRTQVFFRGYSVTHFRFRPILHSTVPPLLC
jgi:hypothetical protein